MPPSPTALSPLLPRWRQSVLVRLGLVMGLLATLSLLSILLSMVIADSSSGKASAINVSGSLRMMSFRLLSELEQPALRPGVAGRISQFESRLHSLQRFVDDKLEDNAALVSASQAVAAQWNERIRPLAERAASGQPEALGTMMVAVPEFVGRIDEVVLLIEDDLERKIRFLRGAQFVLLGVVIAISLLTVWMLRQQLIRPLAELLKAARSVSEGSFRVQVSHGGADELGQLGHAFNTMVGEIASMYAHLEDKVEAKTQELLRTNRSLELLYRTSQALSARELTLDSIQAVLHDIEKELELGHSMVCLSEDGRLPAQPVLGDLTAEERTALCHAQDCSDCFRRAGASMPEQVRITEEGLAALHLPLGETGQIRGAMPILLPPGSQLPREKMRILETVGHHVANALSNMRRTEEKHRLAVLEERSVIARELHDSIAQSLSYLKIQITRLEKSLHQPDEARVIAEELKTGLNSAYRELRELITTFRLRIDERGLNAALQETVEEYSARLGFAVGLNNALSGIALSGNEEMHVIRIIREALANIEKHAQASAACIDLGIDVDSHRVNVCIQDDGCGFDPACIPPNHYGMSIMQDRTQFLEGTLHIESHQPGGSRICFSFQPQQYRRKT